MVRRIDSSDAKTGEALKKDFQPVFDRNDDPKKDGVTLVVPKGSEEHLFGWTPKLRVYTFLSEANPILSIVASIGLYTW